MALFIRSRCLPLPPRPATARPGAPSARSATASPASGRATRASAACSSPSPPRSPSPWHPGSQDPGNYAVEWLLLALALGLGALLHAELCVSRARAHRIKSQCFVAFSGGPGSLPACPCASTVPVCNCYWVPGPQILQRQWTHRVTNLESAPLLQLTRRSSCPALCSAPHTTCSASGAHSIDWPSLYQAIKL